MTLFRKRIITFLLVLGIVGVSASFAQSKVDAIAAEYNRMESEYRTKLAQIDRSISETQNKLNQMQSDPMRSESVFESEKKWLDVLYRDRQFITDALANLQQQKNQAIQKQQNLERELEAAFNKAKQEKQAAERQKIQQIEAEKKAAREAIERQRIAQEEARKARDEERRRIAEEKRRQLEAEFQARFNEGVEEYDRKYGFTYQKNMQYIDNSMNVMADISDNVQNRGRNSSYQVSRGFGRVTAGTDNPAGNKPLKRSLSSIMQKSEDVLPQKKKQDIIDINQALKNMEY